MSTGLPEFSPIRLVDAELARPLAGVEPASDRAGAVYTRAWVLVRLHEAPIGLIEIPLPDGALPAAELAGAIWDELAVQINEHLRHDGMPPITRLDAGGVPGPDLPPCLAERRAATAGTPLVSVIIATRDRTDSLAECLQAFDAVEYPNYEIIVVDNAPATESTAELIGARYAGDPRIRYVREPHPGLGWAHNCGVRHARGEFIAFTDDDVVVDRHWLEELLRGFALGSHVGCVTGLVVPQEIETQSQYWFDVHSGFNKGFRRRLFDLGPNRPDDRLFPYRSSMFGTGANMAFRAGALRAVGGLDPVLGPGTAAKNGEDLDVYFRIIRAGYQLVYLPSAFVRHRHRADYAALRDQFYTYGVGFAAYLAKLVATHPVDGLRLLARMPSVIAFSRTKKTAEDANPAISYPTELTKVEMRGRLYGPLAYARSRWRHRSTLRADRRADRQAG